MKIPDGVKVIEEKRLTLIRAVSVLSGLVEDDGGIKDQVKQSMKGQEALFAQDELAIGCLRHASASFVDARKLYNLVAKGRITITEFLSAITVKKGALKDLLGAKEIEKISSFGVSSAALYTDWKPEIDSATICAALVQALESACRMPARSDKAA